MKVNRKSLHIWLKRLFVVGCSGIALSLLLYMALLRIFPFPYDAIRDIKYSTCIYDKDGNLLRAFIGKDDSWLLPIDLSKINKNFINATLSIEDRRFRQHKGVDVFAISRAIKLNASNKKVISGASTISMQTMRILEGRKQRNLLNKVIEAVHAIRLETLYSKDDILKLYFEIAPYGGNIQGVKAASLRYFKKYPADLTLSECALLAGIPQSPSRLRPDRHPERARKRRDMVLLSMLKNRCITASQYEEAIKEPVIAGNYSFPVYAPHFTEFVKKRDPGRSIRTTIDPDIQHFAETALREMVLELKTQGVTNGAIVVIENKTGSIKAMVGSADFYSIENSGQVNGAISKRCPGSALKPFTYALAFDKGLYTPKMILTDMPVQYDGYLPLDYDKKYRGSVTVREALVDSLNIPAVEVLDNLGYLKLYMFLKSVGVSTLKKSPEHYGLSLTLGSAEVTLLELTNAYTSLARLGIYKPFTFVDSNEPSADSKRVLSEGAAYLVADILSDTDRLQATGVYRDEKINPKVAWKTGTSYGHKDAWTVCYNPEYTIGVWLGNFSGKQSKALVGVDAAAPVAIRIFDWLYAKKAAPWYKLPDSIGERYVCALTGEPVSDNCEHGVKDLYIKQCSIAHKCSFHDRINDKTRLVLDKNKPKIVSPSHKCEYFITSMPSSEQKLVLTANSPLDTDMLYWFVDGRFYDKSYVGEKLFWPMIQGRHTITCSDTYGRSSSVAVIIR